MSATATRAEPFLAAKTLAHSLREQWGYEFGYWGSREIIRAMSRAGYEITRGHSVRASDARKFILANPNWRPFSKKEACLVCCCDEQAN